MKNHQWVQTNRGFETVRRHCLALSRSCDLRLRIVCGRFQSWIIKDGQGLFLDFFRIRFVPGPDKNLNHLLHNLW